MWALKSFGCIAWLEKIMWRTIISTQTGQISSLHDMQLWNTSELMPTFKNNEWREFMSNTCTVCECSCNACCPADDGKMLNHLYHVAHLRVQNTHLLYFASCILLVLHRLWFLGHSSRLWKWRKNVWVKNPNPSFVMTRMFRVKWLDLSQ